MRQTVSEGLAADYVHDVVEVNVVANKEYFIKMGILPAFSTFAHTTDSDGFRTPIEGSLRCNLSVLKPEFENWDKREEMMAASKPYTVANRLAGQKILDRSSSYESLLDEARLKLEKYREDSKEIERHTLRPEDGVP